jgi:hypothetical protein
MYLQRFITERQVAARFLSTQRKRAPELKKALSEKNSCYVLITCGEPTQDGKMQVEMSYDGDPILAAFLVESAHNIIDTQYDDAL